MAIGSRLKEILKEKKMTIAELSEKSGVPKNTLYAITKRDSEYVRLYTLEKIAQVLNVKVTDIIEGSTVPDTLMEDILAEQDNADYAIISTIHARTQLADLIYVATFLSEDELDMLIKLVKTFKNVTES